VVKLVLGQPSLRKRGLKRGEYLLTVGLRRYQAAVAFHSVISSSGSTTSAPRHEHDLQKG
jgi:hypothetical protein